MSDNPRDFTLTGWQSTRIVDSVGEKQLPGPQGTPYQAYYARTTGAVWKTSDKQALIKAHSRTEQLAKVKAPPLSRGEQY